MDVFKDALSIKTIKPITKIMGFMNGMLFEMPKEWDMLNRVYHGSKKEVFLHLTVQPLVCYSKYSFILSKKLLSFLPG